MGIFACATVVEIGSPSQCGAAAEAQPHGRVRPILPPAGRGLIIGLGVHENRIDQLGQRANLGEEKKGFTAGSGLGCITAPPYRSQL